MRPDNSVLMGVNDLFISLSKEEILIHFKIKQHVGLTVLTDDVAMFIRVDGSEKKTYSVTVFKL